MVWLKESTDTSLILQEQSDFKLIHLSDFGVIALRLQCYLMNRLPSSANSNKSAYELLHCKQPSLSHLKVIGCLCYSTIVPKRDKFSARASATILLGYSKLQKGYILLDIHSTKVYVNRDVIFHEKVFPFAKVIPQLDSQLLCMVLL